MRKRRAIEVLRWVDSDVERDAGFGESKPKRRKIILV